MKGKQEIVGRIVVEGQVSIAGDPEHARLPDVHPREELVEEGHHHLFERDEPLAARKGQEPVHVRRDLHPGEPSRVVLATPDLDADVERQVGDVREGVAGIDGERSDHREDEPVEDIVEERPVGFVQALPVAQLDPLGGQIRGQGVEKQQFLTSDHPLERRSDVGQEMLGRAAVESLAGDAGNHLAPQTGYLHLEELVDAFGKEDEELDPLEQGQVSLGH